MSLETTNIEGMSLMEQRFAVVSKGNDIFEGVRPLEPFKEGARGTYGGEFVTQALLVAYETVEDPEFSPHSFHLYFLRAGSDKLVMRWEVKRTSDGRNFCNRLLQAYQSETNVLCFQFVVSFARKNSIKQRKLEYSQLTNPDPKTAVPFEFLSKPQYFFDKYYDRIDELPYITHTHDLMHHAIPEEFMSASWQADQKIIGEKLFGFFFRTSDDLTAVHNKTKAALLNLTFASDSFYLATLCVALGLPLNNDNTSFFRVSLDHAVWFHDVDYDPTEWLFLDYNFSRLSNNRVLCHGRVYNRQGLLVASLVQEGLVYLPREMVAKAAGADGASGFKL